MGARHQSHRSFHVVLSRMIFDDMEENYWCFCADGLSTCFFFFFFPEFYLSSIYLLKCSPSHNHDVFYTHIYFNTNRFIYFRISFFFQQDFMSLKRESLRNRAGCFYYVSIILHIVSWCKYQSSWTGFYERWQGWTHQECPPLFRFVSAFWVQIWIGRSYYLCNATCNNFEWPLWDASLFSVQRCLIAVVPLTV
jgi:hypothetical protein